MQGFNFGLAARIGMKQGIIGGPNDRTILRYFPASSSSARRSSTSAMWSIRISATRSRGVIRVYWVGEDDSAITRYAREYALCAIRDIHTEDVNIITRARRASTAGALKRIHFMSMEGLCRHLYSKWSPGSKPEERAPAAEKRHEQSASRRL